MSKHIHDYECPYFDEDSEHYGYEKVIYYYSGGYDWEAAGVWRRPIDGQLFGWVGSGCSCSSPYDYLPEALAPINTSFKIELMDSSLSGEDKINILRAIL